jgi:hypothetical protein
MVSAFTASTPHCIGAIKDEKEKKKRRKEEWLEVRNKIVPIHQK